MKNLMMQQLLWKFMLCNVLFQLVTLHAICQEIVKENHCVEFNMTALSENLCARTRAGYSTSQIMVPWYDGTEKQLKVQVNTLMSPEFTAEFPQIKTFDVIAEDELVIMGHVTVYPKGFLATIYTKIGLVEIYPQDNSESSQYITSLRKTGKPVFSCTYHSAGDAESRRSTRRAPFTIGASTRIVDFAVVTTGQFAQTHGGNVISVTAIVTQQIGVLTQLFSRDLAVKFNLLTPVIYLDPATDPFDESNPAITDIAEAAIHANWSFDEYDLGHVLHSLGGNPAWEAGGAAGGLCLNATKAEGWSGVGDLPTGSLQLLAHEVGHQFYMDHTFNGTGDNCTFNIADNNSYEIGSGSTIMAYNGFCDPDQNLPSGFEADLYFHVRSIEQALNIIDMNSCYASESSGNTPPAINANICGGSHIIPKQTPFKLMGTGSDIDGDQIYYCWEQFDEDGPGIPTQGKIGADAADDPIAPLFRSYPPTISPVRYFPEYQRILNNDYTSSFEPLSNVARTMTFQLTGRDQSSLTGGVTSDEVTVSVSNAGPFEVVTPNGGGSLTAGQMSLFTWSVNGTSAFCNHVNIRMSINNGLSFPITLANNIANDGNENVLLPMNIPNVDEAWIMIECAINDCMTFFDLSDSSFSITSNCIVKGSNICPINHATYLEGHPDLDFDFTVTTAIPLSSYSFNVGTTDPMMNLVQWNTAQTMCESLPYICHFTAVDFFVDAPGQYSFEFDGPVREAHLYLDSFAPSMVCNNFVGSSIIDGAAYPGIQNTGNMSTCTKYQLVGTDQWIDGTYSIEFSGPGHVYLPFNIPAQTSYTYVAVDQSTQQIIAQSDQANFTTLMVGSYAIYGASYFSGSGTNPMPVDPSTWITQTLEGVYSSGDCVLFSSSFKTIEVIAPACFSFASANVPVNITDNSTVSSVINVTATGTISDLNISELTGSHSFVGDLSMSLTSPEGTTVFLFQNICSSADDFNLILDDQAGSMVDCPLNLGDTEQPQNPLAAFNGENADGIWTLSINDNATDDTGTLHSWGLEICGNLDNCPLTLGHSGSIQEGVYQASQDITADGWISPGTNVIFKAGNSATLFPVFNVFLGAELQILIEDCSN